MYPGVVILNQVLKLVARLMSNCLLIFTRNPELGKVKSRLAQGIGEENALEIYKKLLEHTRDVTAQVDCIRRVGYSVQVRSNDVWTEGRFEKFKQEGSDLGERMENAFKQAFKLGHDKVIIIGSDLYDLRPQHIKKAFEALDQNDAVIGPAHDGGYYLLGMKTLIPSVFKNKNWGTETVLADTLTSLSNRRTHKLEPLNDIDYASDIKPYPEFAHYLP